jgi:hypothetical protein
MTITRKLAVAAIGAGLAASGFLLTQASSDKRPSPADELISPTSPLSSDAIAINAATRAGFVQLCLEGLHDGSAYAKYRAAAAAHPTMAAGLTADCQPVVSTP